MAMHNSDELGNSCTKLFMISLTVGNESIKLTKVYHFLVMKKVMSVIWATRFHGSQFFMEKMHDFLIYMNLYHEKFAACA